MSKLPSRAIVVALGGNLGGHHVVGERILSAVAKLSESWGEAHLSSLYCSAPVGPVSEQPEFLNAVAAFWPVHMPSPEDALEALMTLERAHGRVRLAPGGARTLDLDLLLCAGHRRQTKELELPHPRMHERAFVLKPLCELFGGDLCLSDSSLSVADLLRTPQIAKQDCAIWHPPAASSVRA